MRNHFLPSWKNGMIDLRPDHLEIVKSVLAAHVPEAEVRAFGSRVTSTAVDYSDLDLVIVGDRKIDRQTLYRLEEAFEESDLPFRVDVLDWHRISESFRKVIGAGYEVVQELKQNRGTRPT
jgi:predicted nucleotidyltransferase